MMDQNQHLNKTAEAEHPEKRKPRCCNGFKMFLAALSFSFICKALGAITMKSSIMQIERRFEISSSTAGLIDGSFEIGNLLVIVFVSHFGSRLHRPKLIGIGCFIMGAGTVLTGLPHFFMGYYRYSKETYINPSVNSTSGLLTCLPNQNVFLNKTSPEIVKRGEEKGSDSYMWLFVLMGNMLRGIGETPIGPLGISYLDDFAEEGHSSFYLGTLNALAMIGPIIGFVMGSLVSKMYVDIGYVDLSTIRITPKDSRWVGAWWLSFIIAGLLAILASIPFFFLPKSLDKPQKGRRASGSLRGIKTKEERSPMTDVIKHGHRTTGNMPGFFQSLKTILMNPLYVLALLTTLLYVSSFIGHITYIFKFLEQQYSQSASESNILFGILSLPTIAAGIFSGGYLIKRFKFTVLGIAKFSFVVTTISFLFFLADFLLICDKKSVAGLTLTYDGTNPVSSHINVPRSYCNSDCNCDESQWEPICGDNGITYISPCLAGCKSSRGTKKSMVFYNCTCMEAAGFQHRNNSAHLGECPRSDQCKRKFYIYLTLHLFSNFFASLGSTANVLLIFKNVPPELKSLAVGFHSLIIRTLGGIPAPIYFGALIDRACMKWSISRSGKPGTCRIYDSVLYAYSFLGLMGILRFSTIILFIPLIITMKKKHQAKDIKALENGKEFTNEANLESLDKTEQLLPINKADSETHI